MINVSTCGTRKLLPVPVAQSPTSAAPLASVGGIDIGYWYSLQLGLVFYELLELIERPTVQGIVERARVLLVVSDS